MQIGSQIALPYCRAVVNTFNSSSRQFVACSQEPLKPNHLVQQKVWHKGCLCL